LNDKDVFRNAIETMQNDDSRSLKVRFSVLVGPKSKLASDPLVAAVSASDEEEAFPMEEVKEEENILTLEGQGILIYDKTSGEASHVSFSLSALKVFAFLTLIADNVGGSAFCGAQRNNNRPPPSFG
jgi:serine/threonine-protein kinase RIM15